MCQEENVTLGEWVDDCSGKWVWAPQMGKCVGHQSLGMTSAGICGPIPALCKEL